MFYQNTHPHKLSYWVFVALCAFLLLFTWQMSANAQSGITDAEPDSTNVADEELGDTDELPDDTGEELEDGNEIDGMDRPDATDEFLNAEGTADFQPCLAVNLCFLDAVKATDFTNSSAVEAGLINGGSNLDFVAGSFSQDQIRIKYGCGNGSFCGTHTWTMGDGPTDVDVADFNGDGQVDVIATNANQDRIRIRWGHTGLSSYSHYNVGDYPTRVETADLNEDGLDDFATVNALADTITVRLRNGGGGFSSATYSALNSPHTLAFGDCNGDGDLDMFYDAVSTDPYNPGARIYIRRNSNGAPGQFLAAELVLHTNQANYVADVTLGDYNEDGHLDMIMSLNTHKLAIAYGTGNCDFSNPIFANVSANPSRLRTTDFNRDGNLDFVVGHLNTDTVGKIAIYLGQGDGNFAGPYEPETVDGWWVQDLDVGDFNGDRQPDIVFTQTDGIYILESY